MTQTGPVRRMLWPLVCIVCLSFSQAQEDVDALLEDVFGKPANNLQDQENSVSCTCMPFYRCNKTTTEMPPGNTPGNTPGNNPGNTPGNNPGNTSGNIAENEYGENLIDIKISPEQDAECPHYLDKCCFPQDNTTTPTPNTTPPPVRPTQNTCGARHPDGVGFRITGDKHNEANYGEFPWMVAVIRRDKVIGDIAIKVMECGGSIIHPQVVLTGAHCVKGKKDMHIRAGEWDTQTDKEQYPTQDRDVTQVIIHEGYYAGGLHNDVALLVLDKPLELNEVVGTLCLPEQGEQMDGRNCVVSGWGKDVYGKEGKYQVILKRVEQPVVPKAPCQDALRKTRLGPRFRLHESFICAGGEVGKDACKGDGGSPLACPSKGDPSVYVQAGVVAWGIGCGTTTPAVYANVPHFRKWIDDKIASLHLT